MDYRKPPEANQHSSIRGSGRDNLTELEEVGTGEARMYWFFLSMFLCLHCPVVLAVMYTAREAKWWHCSWRPVSCWGPCHKLHGQRSVWKIPQRTLGSAFLHWCGTAAIFLEQRTFQLLCIAFLFSTMGISLFLGQSCSAFLVFTSSWRNMNKIVWSIRHVEGNRL